MAWRFYVYELSDAIGVAYIGKGSGRRLAVQKRRYGLDGHEVARFKSERHAYAFERKLIAERSPRLNRHPGGNGCRAVRRVEHKSKCERLMDEIGTQAYAARLLVNHYWYMVDPSKLDTLRRIAHG